MVGVWDGREEERGGGVVEGVGGGEEDASTKTLNEGQAREERNLSAWVRARYRRFRLEGKRKDSRSDLQLNRELPSPRLLHPVDDKLNLPPLLLRLNNQNHTPFLHQLRWKHLGRHRLEVPSERAHARINRAVEKRVEVDSNGPSNLERRRR